MADDATQVIENTKPSNAKNTDETVAIMDAETQAVESVSPRKSAVSADDATQVFDDADTRKSAVSKVMTDNDATQVIEEEADQQSGSTKENSESETLFTEDQTQVFEDNVRSKQVSRANRKSEDVAETQVFDNDSTQVIEDAPEGKSDGVVATQVFDEPDMAKGTKIQRKDTVKAKERVIEEDGETQAFSEDETFDITSAATLAPEVNITPVRQVDAINDGATQVLYLKY